MDSSPAAFWLRGLVLGLAIAAPVGPIGVLCIRRTLARGRAAGLVSGLGAATADAVYGSIAAFGLTALSGPLLAHRGTLALAGGLFLCYLGLRSMLARPSAAPSDSAAGSLTADYAGTFLLTLANPMTIVSFAAVFAGLGLASEQSGAADALSLVAGVFCGSALWWLTLSAGVSVVGRGLRPAGLVWINRIGGGVIMSFGLAALAGVLSGKV